MSGSPAAAQAGADNQRFWNGIAKLPEEAQKSFWEAGVEISQFIGENPNPRALTFDTSKPPPAAAWWEKALFYIGQSQYNEAVAQRQAAGVAAHAAVAAVSSVIDGAEWLAGALQGDFNKNPTTGQIVTGGIISMIPIVDQVCDVRDLVANCLDLSDEEARKDHEKWVALGLTCIGFVPEFGSAVKTVAKVAFKKGARLIDLLKHMEWIEKSYRRLKIACPWGFAPIEWLRKYDFVGEFRKGGAAAKKAFENALFKTEAAIRHAYGAVKSRLQQLAELFKAIVAKIVDTVVEIARKVKAKVDELMGGAKKEAGNYDATAGTAPNKHAQGDKPPKGPNKPPRMEPHKPKCFKPGKDLRKNWKGDQRELEKEFYSQLKGQERGINSLTVGEYKENREKFRQIGRGRSSAQEAARKKLNLQIQDSIEAGLIKRDPKIDLAEAERIASERTKEVMSSLAALHEPDMNVGGYNQVGGFGNSRVNSSLGSQWSQKDPVKKLTRVQEMDLAAEEALAKFGPDAKMNVSLDRCK